MTKRSYVVNWVALVALALLTFGLSFASLGTAGMFIAFTIAAVKGVLIIYVFMHLAEGQHGGGALLALAILLVLLLLGMASADVLTRVKPAILGSSAPHSRYKLASSSAAIAE